jgi:hypothetical protein
MSGSPERHQVRTTGAIRRLGGAAVAWGIGQIVIEEFLPSCLSSRPHQRASLMSSSILTQ